MCIRDRFQEVEKTAKRKAQRLADEKETLEEEQEKREKGVVGASQIYPEHDASGRLALADTQANQAGSDLDFIEVIEQAHEDMERADRHVHDQVTEHNRNNSSYNEIVIADLFGTKHDEGHFKSIVELKKQIVMVYNALKNNVLVDRHEELQGLKESFDTAFVTNLCHSIYQSINDGKRLLDDLNKELDGHVFGLSLIHISEPTRPY